MRNRVGCPGRSRIRRHPLGRQLKQGEGKRGDAGRRQASIMDRVDNATGVLHEAAEAFEAKRSGFLDFAGHFDESLGIMIELYGDELAVRIGQALVNRLAPPAEPELRPDPAFAKSLKAQPRRRKRQTEPGARRAPEQTDAIRPARAAGKSYRIIAEELGLSLSTVRDCLRS